MKKYLRLFIIYVVLMLADGGLTLYNTPDLSMEGNPLVTVFQLGWGALLTVNLIFFVIMFFLLRYSFETYQTLIADVPDLKSYVSQLFYNRPDKFSWFYYKLPKNWKPFIAVLGYNMAYVLSAGAVIRVLEWLAITFNMDMTGYNRICSFVFGRLDIVVGLILMIPLTYIWFRNEYRKSQAAAEKQINSESSQTLV